VSGVLAVMDGVVIDYETLLPECAATVREARAAVAELIEAAAEMIGVFEKQAELLDAGCKEIPCPRMQARDQYRAALARVQGGQS